MTWRGNNAMSSVRTWYKFSRPMWPNCALPMLAEEERLAPLSSSTSSRTWLGANKPARLWQQIQVRWTRAHPRRHPRCRGMGRHGAPPMVGLLIYASRDSPLAARRDLRGRNAELGEGLMAEATVQLAGADTHSPQRARSVVLRGQRWIRFPSWAPADENAGRGFLEASADRDALEGRSRRFTGTPRQRTL